PDRDRTGKRHQTRQSRARSKRFTKDRLLRARLLMRAALCLTLPNLRVFEFLSEHVFAGDAEPFVEDGSIDLPEIQSVFQVAHGVVGQAGMFANWTGLDFGAD